MVILREEYSRNNDIEKRSVVLDRVELDKQSLSERNPLQKNKREISQKSIFIRNLPIDTTHEKLEKYFGEIGPIRRCFIITKKGSTECSGIAIVQYALETDCKKAIEKLNGKRFPNSLNHLVIKSAKKRQKRDILQEVKNIESEKLKRHQSKSNEKDIKTKKDQVVSDDQKCRIIIRNIPFECTETRLRKAFNPFGNLLDVQLPKDSSGQLRGFAFLKYSNLSEAKRAMDNMNETRLDGRLVAVDWAIPKDLYHEISEKRNVSQAKEDTPMDKNNEKPVDETDLDRKEDETEGENGIKNNENESDKNSERKSPEYNFSQVSQGATLFVRNLSFDTTREDLKERFKGYGKLRGVYLCHNRDTGMPKGSAFIQFEEKSSADKALEDAYRFLSQVDENEMKESRISLDGRALILTRLVKCFFKRIIAFFYRSI